MTPPAKRVQDYRRAWAARALSHMQLLGPGGGRWVLMVDDRVQMEWAEEEHPGFAEYLALTLAAYHGAWHSANGVALPHVARSRRGGIKGMEQRWAHKQRNRQALEAQIAAARARGEDPHDHEAKWAQAYHYSLRHVRRLIDGA